MPNISLKDGEQARLNITKAQEDAISKMYRQVYLDLKKRMETLPPQGSGTATQSLRRSYLNKLTKQLKEAYQFLSTDLEKEITGNMQRTAQAVANNVNEWVKQAGLKVEGAYSYVPKDIVAALSTGQVYGNGWTLSKAIWGHNQKTLSDIDSIVAAGVAANKSAFDIAKDLEKYVNPSAAKPWDWSKVYPGTNKKVDYNAQRLARTMVSHAYQQSLLATTKYNPFVKGYRWRSAHVDRTCELCNERDGKLFSAEDLPLDHPNGLCIYIAELSGDMNSVADRLADWANGKEDPSLDQWYISMGGEVVPSGDLLTRSFEKFSEEDYKKWQEQNSTYHQLSSSLEQELGDTLNHIMGSGDFWMEDQKMWASEYVQKALEDFRMVTDSTINRYSYVQNADWSKNINRYYRTGDSSFLTDFFHMGNSSRAQAQRSGEVAVKGMEKTAKALDSLISLTSLDRNMVVDRWGGINALETLGITSSLSTERIGHSFVTRGLDLEAIKAQVDGMVGSILTDNGYMSASASSSLNVFQGSDIKFTINVPKGTKAFVTDNLTESEIIFARGTKTEITGCRIIESEAMDTWGTGERVKTRSLEIFMNMLE